MVSNEYCEIRHSWLCFQVNVSKTEPGYPQPSEPRGKKADVLKDKVKRKVDTLAREVIIHVLVECTSLKAANTNTKAFNRNPS